MEQTTFNISHREGETLLSAFLTTAGFYKKMYVTTSGRARQHWFTRYQELIAMAEELEKALRKPLDLGKLTELPF